MNPNRSSSLDGVASGADDDSEVMRVLDGYLSAIEAGQPPDPDKLLADHPAHAGQLRAYLRVMSVAWRLAEDPHAVNVWPTSAPAPCSIALSTLDLGPGPPPYVHLLEIPDEREPLLMPRSAEMPWPDGASLGRYQLHGEIARGGMGAILRGRDVDLGRELAIKVLLDSHQGNSEITRRFVEEAQIGGQLQHPGIVPVYELGTFPDRRPYFAMKLVKGRTLSSLLHERTSPAQDLPQYLSIFEQICQTMAYAHARGVIHRDLKPSNVMVGSFGEVQVMDWGLAKVLAHGGIADEVGAQPMHESVVTTVRSGSAGSGSDSLAGSVLGTPAYMAPEQARGEVEQIDERADVFGLGAILCEILTGRPPYVGTTREEIRGKAAQADLTDAHRRLGACVAEAEVIDLARDCLAGERDVRPRNAGEVTRRLTAYLAGVQERLRAAELARVEAQAKAVEERKRRRLTVALAGSVLVTAGVVGGGWAYLARQRLERAALFNQALGEAEGLYAEAKRVGDDTTRWLTTRDATRALERLLPDAPDESTRRHASGLVRNATQAAASAENDHSLLNRLVDIRSAMADDPDGSVTDADYADAFREAGIDVAALPPAEAGAMLAARPSVVRVLLATAIDDWAAVRRGFPHDRAGALRLTEVARLADPDPWRNRFRDLLQTSASQDRLTSLKDLARSESMERLPAVSFHLLGATILNTGDPAEAAAVLRHGQRLHPTDVWLNFTLAQSLWRLGRREEAIRYYVAARSLRPETAHELGHALEAKGETDEAIGVFQDLTRLRPNVSRHLVCLGDALKRRGRIEEAKTALDAAIALSRAWIRAKPDSPEAHTNLGAALRGQGKLHEAIAEHREVLRLKPGSAQAHAKLGVALRDEGKLLEAIAELREAVRLEPDDRNDAHNNLGIALRDQGKLVEAIAELREAVRVKPYDCNAHNNLGTALKDHGKLVEAITEYREAVRLKPDDHNAHNNLGFALRDQGKLVEAIAELREAVRLEPDEHDAHTNLGIALALQGNLEEAIVALREAVRLKPDDAEAHYNLGKALMGQSDLDKAVSAYREALHHKPDYAEAQCNLGHVLMQQGRFADGLAELKRGHELGSKNANWHYPSAEWVRNAERLVELDRKLPSIISGQDKPADLAESLALAKMCYGKKLQAASARLWSDAFQAQPKLADDMNVQNRYNAACAAALAGSGQGKDDPPLDDAAKTRWRKHALDWLEADLSAWSKIAEGGSSQARQAISKTLQHWKADPDLAEIRDASALAKLPENEQKACRALWAEVDALLAKCQGTNLKSGS